MRLDGLKKLVMFVMTLLFLQTADRLRAGQDVLRFVDRVAELLTLFLTAVYLFRPGQIRGADGQTLTFHFSNPNLAGLFLVCLYMLRLRRLLEPGKWYGKLFHALMAGCLACFVLETRSRNCLLVLALFTAGAAWIAFRPREGLRIGRGAAHGIAWFPAVFAAVYLLISDSLWYQELFAFLAGEGKPLDSRAGIWTAAVQAIAAAPLTGAYFGIAEAAGSPHMHNTHLDVAGSYGIPVLILLCLQLGRLLHQNGRVYSEKSRYLSMLGFAGAVMLGVGESALFSGGLGIYVFAGAFLLLSHEDGRKDREYESIDGE